MNLALKLSGFDKIPGESSIFYLGENIKKILFGIDVFNSDIIAAKDNGYDLIISHHPPNKTYTARFCSEIKDQVKLLINAGVSEKRASAIVEPIVEKFYNWNRDKDHNEVISLATKLEMPLMNIHQPCDELGRRYLQDITHQIGNDATVEDLMFRFSQIREVQQSGEKIELVCGDSSNRLGTTIVVHGVGTNGGYPVATALFEVGVDTVIYIHLLPYQKKEKDLLSKENKRNVILTGHYASDSIGINIFIRKLEELGAEVTRFVLLNRKLDFLHSSVLYDLPPWSSWFVISHSVRG
ncbi:MAG: Nif3-like dinuclear metal center hexameric protein [Candidatus Aureabacteria bacterium]|nr:Nif3-like dinuclear metal center hexameric protein [Candidatus Auribacterota bacterium]